ncbi:hypothetical protein [Nannocystis pusilla]
MQFVTAVVVSLVVATAVWTVGTTILLRQITRAVESYLKRLRRS